MANKFTEGTPTGRVARIDFNEVVTILNRGNNIPQMTTAEIIVARDAEIAAGRNYNAFIKNTQRRQLEYWDNTNNGQPMPF